MEARDAGWRKKLAGHRRTDVAFAGFDGATFTTAPNTGVIFVTLKDRKDRRQAHHRRRPSPSELRKAYRPA